MKEKFNGLVDQLVGSGFFLEEAVELLEKTLIERALEKSRGNRSVAAKQLGIHRNTLQRKAVQYQLAGAKARRKPAVREARRIGKQKAG